MRILCTLALVLMCSCAEQRPLTAEEQARRNAALSQAGAAMSGLGSQLNQMQQSPRNCTSTPDGLGGWRTQCQ